MSGTAAEDGRATLGNGCGRLGLTREKLGTNVQAPAAQNSALPFVLAECISLPFPSFNDSRVHCAPEHQAMDDGSVDLGPYSAGTSQPIALHTNNLCYHVTVPDKSKPRRCLGIIGRPKKERQILDNVTMVGRPGELTAIMGPSGGGKTTLLELISSRVTGNTTGEISLNGTPVTRSVMSKIAGYVKQKDILLPSATVRECIDFSARLRLPANVSESDRKERVEEIIKKLGLTKCADTKVGDDNNRGVSGGELKRTAIGVELVTRPNLLFLDEPTSGLDSSSAFTIVDILKRISREDGTTVICTLHQPRSNIFNLFDRLILLHSGRILYQGLPSDAIQFFQLCGHPCPSYTNPPDFFMDVITDTEIPDLSTEESSGSALLTSNTETASTSRPHSPSMPQSHSRSSGKKKSKKKKTGESESEVEMDVRATTKERDPDTVDEMVTRWRASKKSKKVVKVDESLPVLDVKKRQSRKPGCLSQTMTLFSRAWKNNIRNPLILWAQLLQHIVLALFIGLMYLRIGKKDGALQDRAAAVFFSLLNVSWVPALTAAFVFSTESAPVVSTKRFPITSLARSLIFPCSWLSSSLIVLYHTGCSASTTTLDASSCSLSSSSSASSQRSLWPSLSHRSPLRSTLRT